MYFGTEENGYTYQTPIISEKTFREIVHNICQKKKSLTVRPPTKYLRFSKLTGEIIKSHQLPMHYCGLYVCPNCYHGNCGVLCGRKIRVSEKIELPDYFTCHNCQITFKIKKNKKKFPSCKSWGCKSCESRFSNLYREFVSVPTHKNNKKLPPNTARNLYQALSSEAKKDLNEDYSNLSYSLRIRKNDNTLKLIPPLTFLADEYKTLSFYERLLTDSTDPARVKTIFGSVFDRMEKGKYSAVRQHSHNTRYVKSGRGVIVPCHLLEPDECILPTVMWKRLQCPRTVLAHRYPTLNQLNFSVHRVVKTWRYPVIGIPTSIVRGNGADFDGDAMQIIPMLDPMTEAEALTLLHPAENFVIPGGNLRVTFDHDEILTLYHLYKINGDDIHRALRNLAADQSSRKAYEIFCQLRRLCRMAWFENKPYSVIFTVTYENVLSFLNLNYTDFIKKFTKNSNTLKQIILSRSSRFSTEHLWQMVGIIHGRLAPSSSFLGGMNKSEFIKMAKMSRLASIKDVAYVGYGYLKLLYCTQPFVLGYDGRVYNNATGQLVALDIKDIIKEE